VLAPPEPVPAAPAAPPRRKRRRRISTGIELGIATMILGFIVIIPLGAVILTSTKNGWSGFWADITTPEALSTIKLTVVASLLVGLINAVMGTLIAWLLVRDNFPGKRVIDTLIDLPFALPTVVAGLVLVGLYGAESPINLTLAYTQPGVVAALLFVTLPFVVRTVQPVLLELDREMEQAAASLGAGSLTTFRRIILPNLLPAILAGTALSFARALGEYGSMGFLSGNIPFQTQVASVHIYSQVENDNLAGAAAVATVLLIVSFAVLVLLGVIQRWAARRG
jgi:sulfate/thiosulfate transport system permease protein